MLESFKFIQIIGGVGIGLGLWWMLGIGGLAAIFDEEEIAIRNLIIGLLIFMAGAGVLFYSKSLI